MKIPFWPDQTWRRVTLVVLAVLLVPYVFTRLLSPWRCVSVQSNVSLEPESVRPADRPLRIVSYNIAHGRGVAGSNWGGAYAERIAHLDEIAALLREMDADVVVLNEVDFDSSWSHSINQARYLAQHAGYGYWAEQRNLDFRVLLWKWRFGNAILTKAPIDRAQIVPLPGYSSWETLLAGKKQGLQCDIRQGEELVRVIGVHLEHRDEALRVKSARSLADIAAASHLPVVLAGDLNSTLPGFPHSMVDAGGQNALATLANCGRFQVHPAAAPASADELTFHSVRPRSVIDWVLVPTDWQVEQYRVGLSQLSDHRPVIADVRRDSAPLRSVSD